jgi:hypothetical protein
MFKHLPTKYVLHIMHCDEGVLIVVTDSFTPDRRKASIYPMFMINQFGVSSQNIPSLDSVSGDFLEMLICETEDFLDDPTVEEISLVASDEIDRIIDESNLPLDFLKKH